jgi:hypothetical protein
MGGFRRYRLGHRAGSSNAKRSFAARGVSGGLACLARLACRVSDGVAEVQRLEESEIGTAGTLQNQLLDRRWAVLGARRVVKPFGATGVQWNPADDFCVAAHVTLNTNKAVADKHRARWRLTAELREATR